jgi:hypothetical protein
VPDLAFLVPWLLAALLAVAAWTGAALVARLKALEARLGALEKVGAIEERLAALGEARDLLDLKRLEHVLLDLRDGQRRLAERLLDALEAQRVAAAGGGAASASPTPDGLAERVVTRLSALGFERILVVTPPEELERLAAAGEGAVAVEARRDGAICKGRVLLREGRLGEAEIQPAYSVFP